MTAQFDLTPFGLAPKDLFAPSVVSASQRLLLDVRECLAWRGAQGLTVEGSVGPSHVVLRFFRNEKGAINFVSVCSSCKQVERCIHGAALLTYAHRKKVDIVSEEKETGKGAQSRLSPSVREWITKLRGIDGQSTDQLEFSLEWDSSNSPTLTLSLRGSPFPLSKVWRQWQTLPESLAVPLRLFAGLLGKEDHKTDVRLDLPGGSTLLISAIKSGRCLWNGAKLTWSDTPREGHLGWRVVSDEGQVPTILVDSADVIVLKCTIPLYLDRNNNEVGYCEIPEREEVTALWVCGKEVRSKEVSEVKELLTPLELPPPFIIKAETIGEEPRLSLLFRAVHCLQYRGEGKTLIPLIQVFFRYGDINVSSSDPSSVIEGGRDDRWLKIKREKGREKRLIESLIPLGLSKTKVLHANANLGEYDNSFSIGGEALRWKRFISELTLRGIEISMHQSFPFSITDITAIRWTQASAGEDTYLSATSGEINILELLNFGEIVEKGQDGTWVLQDVVGQRYSMPMAEEICSYLPELTSPTTTLLDGMLQVPRAKAMQLPSLIAGEWEVPEEHRAVLPGQDLEIPKEISSLVTLRDYQAQGVQWLRKLRDSGNGGVLADDMGLGKTLQLLTFLRWEKERKGLSINKPALIVVPTSLLFNWQQEIDKFYPDFLVAVLHGSDRGKLYQRRDKYELYLISYSLLQRDEEELRRFTFHSVTFDEAHYLKNSDTSYARVARALGAEQKLCLSGTPLENHLGELWSLFNLSVPGLLGNERYFKRYYRTHIERGDASAKRALGKLISPFFLRRRKDEVAKELPEKTEIVHEIALPDEQRALYLNVLNQEREKLEQRVNKEGFEHCSLLVLEVLLRLRQCCCDPRLITNDTVSAKLEHLSELVSTLVSEGRRILIFSQFTRMLSLIGERLDEIEIPFVQLTGETRDRGWVVDRFQQGKVPVFLISLKAGGTGLNLTAADTVIHYDPWWNPAVEQQASDRAHRIGQKKPVFVYKLIAKNTIEEKIRELQLRKQDLADSIFENSGKGLELSVVRELLNF